MSVKEIISEGFAAIIGLYIIFQLTTALCEADSSFCIYGWKLFSAIFVALYFAMKYGFRK